MPTHPIVVVDCDPSVRTLIVEALETAPVEPLYAESWTAATEILRGRPVGVVLVQNRSDQGGGQDIVAEAGRLSPTAVLVALDDRGRGAEGTLLRAGAFDVVSVPPARDRLLLALRRALAQHEILLRLERLERRSGPGPALSPIIGRSEPLCALREKIGRAACESDQVRFVGEEGSGRELAARTLHALSPRRGGPFVRVVPPDSSVGSAPAALSAWARELVDQVQDGVLFVRSSPRWDARARAALRVAVRGERSESFRLVSSGAAEITDAMELSWCDLDSADTRRFTTVHVPPLRDRGRDVVLLAQHFVEAVCAINAMPVTEIDPDALWLVESWTWPGNVPELRDVMERAVTLATRGVICPDDLPEALRREGTWPKDARGGTSPRRFRDAKRRVVESFERTYLEELLGWHNGNVTAAAGQAGMLRSALQRLLRKHELQSAEFRRRPRPAPTPRLRS